MTRAEVLTSYLGQTAGVVALLLAVATFVVAAVPASRGRDRSLVAVVVAQAAAVAVLVASQVSI
ncbi:hypothetical protein [Terrabacter lapilli]